MSRPKRTEFHALEDFWRHVQIVGGGAECWNWTASRNSGGYGQFWLRERNISAHIISYELRFGPIPAHLCVLHRCDNRACVNPNHLFLGTKRDNSVDMTKKQRQWKQPVTHCPQGHPYDEANTRLYQGRRYCRICRYEAKMRLNRTGPIAGLNAEKTHCPQGHEYNAENTWTDSNNQRHCRVCGRERQRARRIAKRGH